MRITVVGLGYVGASTAVLLAQKHHVTVVDIKADRLDDIRCRRAPIHDTDMDRILSQKELDITVSEDDVATYLDSEFVIICTPTDHNSETGRLDTSSVESVIIDIMDSGSSASIVIKSTVPTGFMSEVQKKYPERVFLYAPEFLREGRAMRDQMEPTRVVIGYDRDIEGSDEATDGFAKTLLKCIKKDVPILKMSFGEAEAVKLYSNTYLAMRVAFFNELDALAEKEGYDTKRIIEGVCLDPRVGDHYNNPSFGYGGYCLPKDTKQLLSDYEDIPQKIISAIVDANEVRKKSIADHIIERLDQITSSESSSGDKEPARPVVGIYRLVMKTGSENFRESSMLDIIRKLKEHGVEMLVYEPILNSAEYEGVPAMGDLGTFKEECDLIVANRVDPSLDDVMDKVYTRDIYSSD